MPVVHCKKEKYDVYIGRPSKWGNPFTIGKDGTRDEVIGRYKTWVETQTLPYEELRGKVLGCWCAPLPCHGDILMELANRPEAMKAQLKWFSEKDLQKKEQLWKDYWERFGPMPEPK